MTAAGTPGCGSRYCAISPAPKGSYAACACTHLELIGEIMRLKTERERLVKVIQRHNRELGAELEVHS